MRDFVDDGSTDQSRASKSQRRSRRSMSWSWRNTASMPRVAGFESSSGEIVITMDADLQNPPEDPFGWCRPWKTAITRWSAR